MIYPFSKNISIKKYLFLNLGYMENMKTTNGFVIYTINNMIKTYLTDFDSDDWTEEKTKSCIFESFEDAVGIVTDLSKSYPENIYGTEPFDIESFNEYCSQTVSTWINSEGV